MPGQDGVEVCRRLRASTKEPYIYVLLLTGRADSQDLVEAIEAGADDYLTKPFNAAELRARLRAGRRIVELQEQLLEAQEALRQQATHDALTGLLNRAAILQVLQRESARSTRDGQPLSILMVDLDHFKQINDDHGHLAGDAVLREAARRMGSCVRLYDSLGRYGGEEFLAVLPGCDFEGAAVQAERLRRILDATPFEIEEVPIRVTCSVGCVTQLSGAKYDTDGLVQLADCALYGAKRSGRNRIEAAQEHYAIR